MINVKKSEQRSQDSSNTENPANRFTDITIDMKKLLKYWLPPLVWMAIIFPVGNKAIGSPFLWRINRSFWVWLLPETGIPISDVAYVVIRKTLHFIEYGILAFLLYRGFRAGAEKKWHPNWAVYAGTIAISYGFLDEFLQSFVPNRNGSFIDALINTAGIASMLGLIFWRRERQH